MGASFISFKSNALRIRAGHLGTLFDIIRYEFNELIKQTPEQPEALRNLVGIINERALYGGYTTVVELDPILKTPEDVRDLLAFFDYLRLRLSKMDDPLPVSYLELLLEVPLQEIWRHDRVTKMLDDVAALITTAAARIEPSGNDCKGQK